MENRVKERQYAEMLARVKLGSQGPIVVNQTHTGWTAQSFNNTRFPKTVEISHRDVRDYVEKLESLASQWIG